MAVEAKQAPKAEPAYPSAMGRALISTGRRYGDGAMVRRGIAAPSARLRPPFGRRQTGQIGYLTVPAYYSNDGRRLPSFVKLELMGRD